MDMVLMADSLESIKNLTDKDAGVLIKALINHMEGVEPAKLTPMAAALYPLIRGQVDRIADLHQKRSIAGRLGGAKTKQSESKTEANEKQTLSPKPIPIPTKEKYIKRNAIERSKKVQNAYGFSTERDDDIDYNEVAKRLREAREAEGE